MPSLAIHSRASLPNKMQKLPHAIHERDKAGPHSLTIFGKRQRESQTPASISQVKTRCSAKSKLGKIFSGCTKRLPRFRVSFFPSETKRKFKNSTCRCYETIQSSSRADLARGHLDGGGVRHGGHAENRRSRTAIADGKICAR